MIFIVHPHGLHVLLGEIRQDIFILWFRVYETDYKTTLCPIVPGMHGKYILHKTVSIYKVYSTKSVNRTHLDYKHMHMMKSGAPTDKVRVLHRLLQVYIIP